MKKFFSLIVMAVMCTCFVSCGNDDDNNGPVVNDPVFSSVKGTLSLKFTEATLNLANVVVSYPNSEGKMVRESVLKPDWKKTVDVNKPISEFEFQVFITKMPVIDISDNNPTFSTAADGTKYAHLGLDEIELSMVSCDQNGQDLSGFRVLTKSTSDKKSDEINEFFEVHASGPYYSWAAVFDKNGKGSEKNK